MGFFDEFINTQISGIGALFGSYRTMPFSTEHNDKFLDSLKPGTVIVQGPVKANYVSGGIQGAAGGSFWTHVIIYAGKYGGQLVRDRWNKDDKYLIELVDGKYRRTLFPELCEHEFVEATYPLIRIGDLEKDYCNDQTQQVAFIMDLNDETLYQILNYAYSKVGTTYDYSEIVSDAFPKLQINHHKNRHGCSSLTATSFNKGHMSIIPENIAPSEAFPKHIYETLHKWKAIPISKWNLR